MKSILAHLILLGGWLLMGSLANAQETVVITEFLADNSGGLLDEDGQASDWIEIYNSGNSPVNLLGWYLTDNTNDLRIWAFPNTNIAAKGFLIVFASGKDRAVPGAPLHTSFSLDANGEYLALVHPDGVTIASDFAPQFPEQHANFSYGVGQNILITRLITNTNPVKVLVPTGGSLGLSWVSNSFDDSSWISGTNGVGYETSVPGFAVRNFKANVTVDSLAKAETVITNRAQQVNVFSENKAVVNYVNTGSGANFGGDSTFPGLTINVDVEDFVLEATATVTIPAAGNWTFGVNSDDGFKLAVGSFTSLYDPPRGPGDTLATFNFPAAGDYPLRLVFYERGGGSEVELFAAQGSIATFSTAFKLVGDVANGGLAVRSIPLAGGGGGLGYRSMIRTDLQSLMLSNNPSAFIRFPFNVASAAAFTSLTLQVEYDDGFVAYLNGVEVARRNSPLTAVWNSTATAAHLGTAFEDINISERVNLLHDGANLLAIQGLNDSSSGADFFILAELAEFKPIGTTNQYFPVPTPGAFNGAGVYGFVADTKFSHDRGFYETNFSCVIATATAGATIKYTLNGTTPSATNGIVYSGPIPITNTTVLRAVAIKDGLQPADVDTETYIFVNDVIRQSPTGAPPAGWPASWGANVVDYGMDPDIVNNPVWGAEIKDDLKAIPSFSIVTDLKNLFDPTTGIYANPSGDEITWERPCSLELVYPDGTEGFQINCGIRVRGGFSRDPSNPKHAFRFFFRQDYGNAKLNYPLFGDAGTDTFNKFDLRTMQNYSWAYQNDARMICIRDVFSRETQRDMGQAYTRGDFYHLYINGQYWGLYNIEERPEANFGESYFGGRAEDYDTVKVDPDLGYNIEPTDGSLDAWMQLWQVATNGFSNDIAYFKIQGLNVDGTPNPAYENLLDVDNLIDYMLVILYGGNLDAPISNFIGNDGPNNWFGVRSRTGLYGGFRFMSHDAEHTLLNVNEDRTGLVDNQIGVINPDWTAGNPITGGGAAAFLKSSPQYIWFRLAQNAEFRIRAADRIQKHLFNGGALSVEGGTARYLAHSNDLYRAIVCESARWGDSKRAVPFSRSDWLAAFTNNTYGIGFIRQRTPILLNQLKADGFFPNIAPPILSQYGGLVPPGFSLSMTNPNVAGGTIYYTLDGSDPRVRGGGVLAGALTYLPGTPIVINFPTTVRARVLSGTTWSAIIEATFYTTQEFSNLLVTEIMYHPPDNGLISGDEYEFLELKNAGTSTLDLSGISFSAGISFKFTNGTRLAPGQFFVLGRNPAELANKYPGLVLNGVYSGKLDNGGETLTLSHPLGGRILSFAYNDAGHWPLTPDGLGFSLVPLNPNANPDHAIASNWRASTQPGGSPGTDDPLPAIARVVINEVLTHTALPDVDKIELYNPTAQDANIGGWFLTDDPSVLAKFRIPSNTIIPAGGYLVFTEADFNPTPGTNNSFALDSHGDQIYLVSADANTNFTGYSHGFRFDAQANGVSFGRYVISTGDDHFVAQTATTFGAANAGPKIGPVVISEIMYHPQDLPGGVDDQRNEYIKLDNFSSQSVPLFDPSAPTNTWRLRGGIGFDFPTNVTLAAGGSLVLVSFDPNSPPLLAAFRVRYPLFISLPVFGPYSSKLNNDFDDLELQRPDVPETNAVPHILVDQVEYKDSAPWPAGADGTGASLHRVNLLAYGNDPINWVSAAPLSITSQPQSLVGRPGTNAFFSATAIGTGTLRYQWRQNGVPLPGETHPTLSILNVQPSHGGVYTVVVSDNIGSALSAPANLIVLVNPVVAQQPQNQTVVVGDTLILSITASNTCTLPMGYRWRRGGSSLTNFVLNQSTSFLILTNVGTNVAGIYTVVLTNLALPSPGVLSSNAVVTVLADSDGDHVPDLWEIANGFNPNDPSDATLDTDGDGMTNLQEYIAGTDPRDPQSYLRIDADGLPAGGGTVLHFIAVSNKTYTVQYSDSFGNSVWGRLTDISPAAPTNRTVTVTNAPAGMLERFYRLATPQLP